MTRTFGASFLRGIGHLDQLDNVKVVRVGARWCPASTALLLVDSALVVGAVLDSSIGDAIAATNDPDGSIA